MLGYCVLVKIPMAQSHKAAQRVPGWWIVESSRWGVLGSNVESLVVEHSG